MERTLTRALLATVTLACALTGRTAAAPGEGKTPTASALEIRDFELARSRLGAPLAERAFVLAERVYVRFSVSGFSPPAGDPHGFSLEVGLAVRPPGSKETPPVIGTERGPNAFAVKAIPLVLSFPIGGAVASGPQEIILAVVDEPTGRRVERRERFEVRRPEGLVIMGASFASDPEGRFERPPIFMRGEDVFLAFAVGGLERKDEGLRALIDVAVIDAATGTVLTDRPSLMKLEAKAAPGFPAIDASTALSATRAGRFRLRIVAHDENTGGTATLERDFRVLERPEK